MSRFLRNGFPSRQLAGGFVLPSAIFLIVILASLAAFLVTISTTQSTTSAQDVQGTRAYHAARAGIEWGLYRVLDPANATATSGSAPLPNCPGVAVAAACPSAGSPSSSTLPGAGFSGSVLSGIAVTLTCHCADFVENGRNVRVFQLRSTATTGSGQMAVERQVQARVAYCRDPGGSATTQPPYGCQ